MNKNVTTPLHISSRKLAKPPTTTSHAFFHSGRATTFSVLSGEERWVSRIPTVRREPITEAIAAPAIPIFIGNINI